MRKLLFLATTMFAVIGFSQNEKSTVDALMLKSLKSFHAGDVEGFISIYDDSYQDVRIQRPGSDKENLLLMVTEVANGDSYKSLRKRPMTDYLIAADKQVLNYEEAKATGQPMNAPGIVIQPGDYIVSYNFNNEGFFRGRMTKVFRKKGGSWKIVGGL